VSDAGTLCLACGLCCDGTLFGLVRIDDAEAAAARRHGLRVVTRDDGTVRLQQPCTALEGTACRVYAQRPRTCRQYVCDLANALDGGEVSLSEALVLVEDTTRFRAALATALGPDDQPTLGRRLQQRARDAHRPFVGEPLPDETLALLTELEDRLDHVFRGRRG
jgi:hypothetical protein